MSETLLVLLIGGTALGLAGVLALLAGIGRSPVGKPGLSVAPPAAQEPYLPREGPLVLFPANSSQLPAQAARALQAWADGLEGQPEVRIVVVGSADTAGNPSRNRALARERAQAAARVLRAAGVPAQRLDVQWREPEPGRTDRDQAALRCVRIHAVLDESRLIFEPQ